MLKDINEIRDAYNEIRKIERRIHRVKTMHSLGKTSLGKTKRKLRFLENELSIALRELPAIERHYYYYKRLYGHPVRPAGKVRSWYSLKK